jgi:DNA-binding response OmpR family regulator
VSEHERSAVVIEDDPDVRALLTELLKQSGFAVTEAASGAEGVRLVRESDADLVTLDLNLPDLDGIEVCRRIRETSEAYIVMLTGRPDEIDRLVGLETGADDYLTKPFSPRELALRVRSVLRRGSVAPAGPPVVLTDGNLVMSAAARSVTVNGEPVSLTNREFDLLLFFLTHPGTVFTREELLKQVWQWDFGDLSTVTVHVKRLRSKLGGDHRVHTVWGRGYAWSGTSGAKG